MDACDKNTMVSRRLKRQWDSMDIGQQLRLLSHYSLDVKREILLSAVPLNDGRPESTRERALLLAAADSTLNQQIKVDEAVMRSRQDDDRQAILERIAAKLLSPRG